MWSFEVQLHQPLTSLSSTNHGGPRPWGSGQKGVRTPEVVSGQAAPSHASWLDFLPQLLTGSTSYSWDRTLDSTIEILFHFGIWTFKSFHLDI